MAEFDFKTATPDATFPSGGFLFGADSQSAGTPSIYDAAAYKDYILGLANTWAANGAASTPSQLLNGTWFTGGSATTTKPQFLVEPTGTTSTGWSTSGTGIGANAASGFAGRLLDLQVAGVSKFNVTSAGGANASAAIVASGSGALFQAIGGDIYTDAGYRTGLFPGYFSATDGTTSSTNCVNWFYGGPNIWEQRKGTSEQTLRLYGNYVGTTDYHRAAFTVAKTTLANVSGASVTATGLIPDGAFCIGVTTKVTTAISGGGGTTGYQVGDGSDADRWGEATTITAGTSTDNTNATANPTGAFTAAQNVVITAVGGNFNGTGDIMVCAFYLIAQAD